MPDKPSGLSRFWNEVKRRNVHRTLAIYAGTAFIILEAATIIFPRWGLPDWTIDLVLYLLIIGVVITVIIAWIYDITPKGVQKTKPLEEVAEGDQLTDPRKWKAATYISLVVIVALIVYNVLTSNKTVRAGDIQSLVILPFDNFTGDDDLDYFVSGMHASLIGDFGRISGLRVISKTSSNVYKGVDMSVPQIAAELEVDAVVESTVMCLGDSICLQVKVISAFPEEKQLWIADYKEEKSQILNLYNRITKQIADEVKIELTADEDRLLVESKTVDPEAYDAYLKGLFYLDKIDKDALQRATEYFNTAIKIEPDWAPPYAGLAEVVAYRMQMSFIPPSVAIPKIYENLNKALELDPNSSNAHYTKAVIAVWTEWNWEKGEKEFVKALKLNPSNALCRMFYAHLLNILHRSDEALCQANQALKLDPHRPFILGLYGALMTQGGNPQSAILYLKKALSIDPNHRFAISSLSGAYRQIGDYEKWFEYFKKITRHDDNVVASIDSVFQEQGYLAAVEMTIMIDEEAANERYINIVLQGYRYMQIYNYDKAMDCYEKGYEIHNPNMPYITTNSYGYDQLKENPRYIKLLKKMNLSLPKD